MPYQFPLFVAAMAIVAICIWIAIKRWWRGWDPLFLVLAICIGAGFSVAALLGLSMALTWNS